MATVKKAFLEVHDFLTNHQDSTVSDILPDLEALMGPKAGGGRQKGSATNAKFDADGNVTHIFCYYHKLWEPVAEVEFGKKASSATGLNSMCKEGLAHWTKQQHTAKKAKMDLLEQVSRGNVAPEDVAAMKAEIDEAAQVIVPRQDGIGLSDI